MTGGLCKFFFFQPQQNTQWNGLDNSVTTGKVYSTVIDKERRGEYLGKTVQVPQIPNVPPPGIW